MLTRCSLYFPPVLAALGTVIIGEILCKGWGTFGGRAFLINVLLAGALSLLLSSLLGKRCGPIAGILFFSSFYLVNYYVIKFKGTPVVPWDIGAIKTALAVSGKYSFAPDSNVLLFLFLLSLLVAATLLSVNKDMQAAYSLKKRGAVLVCAIALGLLAVAGPLLNSIPVNTWGQKVAHCYKEYGTISSFVNYYKHNHVKKPKGYSRKSIAQLRKKYSETEADQNKGSGSTQDHPDLILMVMNESFANMDGYSSSVNIDEMPFFDTLSKESASGELCVSVRGGGTCNTEFEALTGYSTAFLPGACYPFVSFLNGKEVPSLARYFRSKDYAVAGLHLEDGTNWSRDTAYQSLGLQPFYTIDDFKNITTLRGYATDDFNYEKLLPIEKNMDGARKFLFNVTIQNHGGYDTPLDGERLLHDLSGVDEYVSAQTYFNLIKLSDNALKQLVAHCRRDKRKIMLVFFGDHQPVLESEASMILFKDSDSTLNCYKTPLLIWKNYDKKKRDLGTLSPNYLPMIIAKETNYPLTPFMAITSAAHKAFPVLTTQGGIDAKGKHYDNLSKVKHSKKVINDYMLAQYDGLFGEHRLD